MMYFMILLTEDAEDQEVCEITQGKSDESIDYSDAPELPLDGATGSSTSLPAHITAASVAQFMKRMNRIRFNSMNVDGAQVCKILIFITMFFLNPLMLMTAKTARHIR